MRIYSAEIPDIKIIEYDKFEDSRGFFFESYNKKKYYELGDVEFVQDNFSKSIKGTIRGLHYQIEPFAQGKLCCVLVGKVIDVAVDIRKSSPTFGKHILIELSDENNKQIYIPPGFAHGFAVLSDYCIFHYKCSNYYDKNSERSIRFDDSDLNIKWGISNPIISEKDLKAPLLKEQKDLFK